MEEGLVSVDKFSGGSQVYFLTHLHQDHTRGLGAAGGWRHGPLYCSPTTARLLPIRFPGIDASLLRPLAPGASASISLSSPSGQSLSISVTAIPALHCPGSLMYLFRGDLGCMLYTGDFRWELGCHKARRAKQALLAALGGDTIDVLYLDNTYCHPSLNFPPRPVVAEHVVDIIRAHPDHEVIIGVDTLGKEDLLLRISRALQTKIWVWPERLLTIHLLGIDENHKIFTTQTSLTRIRAVPRYSVTINNLEALNTVCPTIGIMPSGIPWLWKSSEGKVKSKGRSSAKSIRCLGKGEGLTEMHYNPLSPPKLFDKDSYALPYSEHACFSELEDFMYTVRPSSVIGIVSSSLCYVNPRHHFRHLYLDSNVNDDRTPMKNKGGDSDKLTPKRRQNGPVTPEERKVRISSSSLTPIKNKGGDNDKLTPKRRQNDSVTPEERKVRIPSSSLTPIKNKGGDNDELTPKRRQNGSVTPKERKVRIFSSSLYRSKVTIKRRECCGARIDDTEENIGVA